MQTIINTQSVPVSGDLAKQALGSKIFTDWVAQLDPRFVVRSVTFQSVDMVKDRVMFLKFSADVVDQTGKWIPGVVFMRGGSVAILPVLLCEGRRYSILVKQPRFPVGRFDLTEIPAGMLDGAGNFVGKAAGELKEELGISIAETDLFDLTAAVYGDTSKGVYPSPGGSDEFIRILLWERDITSGELAEFQGKATGLSEEGEQITLVIVPFEQIPALTPDMKALSALALYNHVRGAQTKTVAGS